MVNPVVQSAAPAASPPPEVIALHPQAGTAIGEDAEHGRITHQLIKDDEWGEIEEIVVYGDAA